MSDIVERLNGIFRAENAALNLMGDAADEITRLRAENERLRAALEDVLSYVPHGNLPLNLYDKARAALGDTHE